MVKVLYELGVRERTERFVLEGGDEAFRSVGRPLMEVRPEDLETWRDVLRGEWVRRGGKRTGSGGTRSDMPVYAWRHELPTARSERRELVEPLSRYCVSVTVDVEGEAIDIFRPCAALEGAVDFESSDVWRLPGAPHVFDVRRWAFHEENIPESGVFSVAETPSSPVFITGDIAHLLVDSGLRNVEFSFVWSSSGEVFPDLTTGTEPSVCEPVEADGVAESVVAVAGPLPDELGEEVAEAVLRGRGVLGVPPEAGPVDVLEAVDDWVRARPRGDVDDVDLVCVGAVVGEQFRVGLGWEWSFVDIDEERRVGMVDPRGEVAMLPIIRVRQLVSAVDSEPNLALSYTLVAAGRSPAARGDGPTLLW